MASSTINIVREAIRQSATGDLEFFQKMTYFFELQIPDELALFGNNFLFPLILGPNAITMEEPFSVEATQTLGGGLYVEENGIIQRTLRISGHTGFKPRKLADVGPGPLGGLASLSPDSKSFDRTLPAWVLDDLSGQRHFQYLQDAVFRTYGDLKRDPATAEDTKLMFHNPKDQEHWEVVPRSFTMERSTASPMVYNYTIDLLIVGAASAVDADFSEDESLLDAIKDVMRTIQSAFNLITGAIQDLTNLVNEIKGLIANIGSIISSALAIVDAIDDFVTGVTDLINAPAALIKQVADEIEAAVATLEDLRRQRVEIGELDEDDDGNGPSVVPDPIINSLQILMLGLDMLGLHPEVFETPARAQMRKNKARQELATSATKEALTAAAENPNPPRTLTEVANMGTALLPGDKLKSQAELGVGRAVPQYTGAREVAIAMGDTLVTLAAAKLGDARAWQDIAVANGLKPPFVDDQMGANLGAGDESPFPSALGIGQKLVIPNFSKPPQKQTLLPVLGVAHTESAEVHLLGADIEMGPAYGDPKDEYDIPIDTDRGSTDLKIVKGRDNLAQQLRARLRTEQGHDILYKKLGLKRIISLNIKPVDLELARFRIAQTILADPRIARIRRVTLEQGNPVDSVEVAVEAEVRGFSETASVKAVV